VTDTGIDEFLMDRGVVDRYKAVCLEKIEEFVEEVVRICANEPEEILDIVLVERSKVATMVTVNRDRPEFRPPHSGLN
jgi:hypothetical protein